MKKMIARSCHDGGYFSFGIFAATGNWALFGLGLVCFLISSIAEVL